MHPARSPAAPSCRGPASCRLSLSRRPLVPASQGPDFSSDPEALFQRGAPVVTERTAGLLLRRVNAGFSLKINSSTLFHPLRVVGGIEKGGDQRLRKKRGDKKETGKRLRELREGGEKGQCPPHTEISNQQGNHLLRVSCAS